MINSKKILAIIPARLGSKGVPRKNIKNLKGKPLIYYSINSAKKSNYIDDIIVSTESNEIKKISKKYGINDNYIRPKKFAEDNSKAIDLVKHLIDYQNNMGFNYDLIIYLEPTSPLRTNFQIDKAIELFDSEYEQYDSLVTVSDSNQYHPIFMKTIVDGKLVPIWRPEPEGVPRQLITPKAYMRNGSVYIIKPENVLKNIFYGKNILPMITPFESSVSIDDEIDWKIVENLI